MRFFMLFPYYIYWHYSQGFKDLMNHFFNVLIFEFHLFSIKELVKTIFEPLQRLQESYTTNIFNIQESLSSFFINLIMRIIGFVCRSFIIVLGLSVLLFTVILFPIVLLIWTILPFFLLFFGAVSLVVIYNA